MARHHDRQRMLDYLHIDAHAQVQSGGGQYFYLKRVDGVVQIFKSSFKNAWPHQLTFFREGVDGYAISPDGRLLAVIENIKGSERNPIAIVDTTTGGYKYAIKVDDVQSNSIVWRRDSSGFLFRSNLENGTDFKIYEYCLFRKTYEKLIDTTGYVAPLDFSPDGKKVLYIERHAKANQDLYIFDVETKEIKHLTPHSGYCRWDARFGRNGEELYALTDKGEDKFCKLYHWDLGTEELTPIGPSIEWELGGLVVSPNGRYVMYSANREGYGALLMVDGWLNVELPMPGTKGLITNYFFHDDLEIVFAYEYPKRAPEIYHWDCKTENVTQLTWACYQGINPNTFTQPSLIEYESFDGLKVPAFLYLPKNYKRGTAIPMVVNFHGGPEGQFRPIFWKYIQYFLELGIGVCSPNVRGSDGYGADYLALDDYKKRMDSVQDGIELGRYLVAKGYTKPDRLGVIGGSYGGFMVLSVITEAPDLWAAACDRVGISNLETFLENTKPYRRKIREIEYGPLTDREFLRSISPIYKMDKVEAPLLVVHGVTDPRVPIEEAEQVVEALKKRDRHVEKLFFEDEGHGIRKLKNQIIYHERVYDFFLEHLAGTTSC